MQTVKRDVTNIHKHKIFPTFDLTLSFEVFHNELAGKRCDEIIENIDRVYRQVYIHVDHQSSGKKAFEEELHMDFV